MPKGSGTYKSPGRPKKPIKIKRAPKPKKVKK